MSHKSDKKQSWPKDDAPRPSQAEGEEEGQGHRPSGATPMRDDAPRPSQAEGSEEDVEEALRRQEQKKQQR
jgi:hypothetical protein